MHVAICRGFRAPICAANLELIDKLKGLAAAENCTPAQLALAWVLSRARHIVPIPGTSHRHRLEENAAAATIEISADTEHELLKVFVPGAASGLRYPENHLVRLGIRSEPFWTSLTAVSDAFPANRAGDGGANVNRHRRGRRASAGQVRIHLSSSGESPKPRFLARDRVTPGAQR
jgi:hypothetical protein